MEYKVAGITFSHIVENELDVTYDLNYVVKLDYDITNPEEFTRAKSPSGKLDFFDTVVNTYFAISLMKTYPDGMSYDDVLNPKEKLALQTLSDINWRLENYGVVVNQVFVESLSLNPSDKAQFEKLLNESNLIANNSREDVVKIMAEKLISAQNEVIEARKKSTEEIEKKTWTCSCGRENDSNFCRDCGQKRPPQTWTCSCGNVNSSKFCPQCGAKRTEV